MPRLVKIQRRGPVLHGGHLNDQSHVLSLNLTSGCVHRCAFCSVRASPSFPGDEVLNLYQGTAKQLDEELALRFRQPRAVYISPATDPFPPLSEVQAETAHVVAVLAKYGVDSWLMTRGFIRPDTLNALVEHRKNVRVTIAMTTLNRKLQRTLEPMAAAPNVRLRQIKRLVELGITVQVALEPLIPGLTDTRDNLMELLHALAESGVKHISAGYMFLRPKIQENLVKALKRDDWDESVLDQYENGPMLRSEQLAMARYLPKARRQRGYASLMALASEFGISVGINGLTNPDFHAAKPSAPLRPRQALLPAFGGASTLASLGV